MSASVRNLPTLITAVLILVLAGSWLGIRQPGQGEVLELTGPTMGTGYSVKLIPAGWDDAEALHRAIDAELQHIDELMSTYREDSELSRFNQLRSSHWHGVSPETLTVINAALEVSGLTDGALDITVGPLVNLWGFGPDGSVDLIPTDDRLEAARQRVGLTYLEVRQTPPAIRKQRPDLYLDLSAIAKGYAVDRIAELMGRRGIANYLVEIGGEIRASGEKSDGKPWRIAIERPTHGVREVQRVLDVVDRGVATSGDYRNYFELDGTRYSHVIDPRTGWPVPQTVASVTVVSKTAMMADALATAIMVLGADPARAWVERHQVAAVIIERADGDVVEYLSPAFLDYLKSVDEL